MCVKGGEGGSVGLSHVESASSVASSHGVSVSKGLSSVEAGERLKLYGLNELEHSEGGSLWSLILEQFDDLLVRILLGAALVGFLLALLEDATSFSAFVEPLVIVVILVLNAAVSIWQETNAEKALEALKQLQPESARVLRDGNWQTIPANKVVPGDVLFVRVGAKVPCDCRIHTIHSTSLTVEESQLTGESSSVSKQCEALDKKMADCILQDKKNMLLSSTLLSTGSATCIAVGTGMNTEIGKIQRAVQEAGSDGQSPLQQKLDEFGHTLSKIILAICVVVWAINFQNFSDPIHGSTLKGAIYYFKIAVALAVAAIPEGLPAVITTSLALGTRRMARRNAIVRKLTAVESLGCVSVVCSDKTGTLTTNQMSCVRLTTFSNEGVHRYCISGNTYAPIGSISLSPVIPRGSNILYSLQSSQNLQNVIDNEAKDNNIEIENKNKITEGTKIPNIDDAQLAWVAACAACANDALLERDSKGRITRVGEPTEAALITLVEKMRTPGLTTEEVDLNERYQVHKEDGSPIDRDILCENSQDVQTPPQSVQNSFIEKNMEEKKKKIGIFTKYWREQFPRELEFEFCRERKSMSVLCTNGVRCPQLKSPELVRERVLFVKGAPESILNRCCAFMGQGGHLFKMQAENLSLVRAHVDAMAADALRVLALAVRFNIDNDSIRTGNANVVESKLILLGIVGLVDPPRVAAREAISRCRRAGVRVIMITGDNKLTAEAISCKLSIIPTDFKEKKGHIFSITGKEFENLTIQEKNSILESSHGIAFSRTEPTHKLRILEMLKGAGNVTAMTGDGVNDAPALKHADVGVAMGIAGTDVAKEASDLILADDNFATIVAAIEEGRSIYDNMKAFIRYLISSNIGEVACIFLTAALGIPEGLVPVQLLWINLVTDGPPATALGFNPPDPDVMSKPPRHRTDALITPWVFFRYCVIGLYVGIATVAIFIYYYIVGIPAEPGMLPENTLISYEQLSNWHKCPSWGSDFYPTTIYNMDPYDPCSYFTHGKIKASTLSLTVLVVIEMLNALNAISEEASLLTVPPHKNPYLLLAIAASTAVHCAILYIPVLSQIFGVVPLNLAEWKLVIMFSLPVIFIDEILKFCKRLHSFSHHK